MNEFSGNRSLSRPENWNFGKISGWVFFGKTILVSLSVYKASNRFLYLQCIRWYQYIFHLSNHIRVRSEENREQHLIQLHLGSQVQNKDRGTDRRRLAHRSQSWKISLFVKINTGDMKIASAFQNEKSLKERTTFNLPLESKSLDALISNQSSYLTYGRAILRIFKSTIPKRWKMNWTTRFHSVIKTVFSVQTEKQTEKGCLDFLNIISSRRCQDKKSCPKWALSCQRNISGIIALCNKRVIWPVTLGVFQFQFQARTIFSLQFVIICTRMRFYWT